MANFRSGDTEPERKGGTSIADKVLSDSNPGAACTRNGVDVGDAPRSDLRRPTAANPGATRSGNKPRAGD